MAPGVRVELAPFSYGAIRELTEGRYDALIAPTFIEHEGLRREPLGTWSWAVYGRKGHPAFQAWSPEAWSAYPHLQIRITSARGKGQSARGPPNTLHDGTTDPRPDGVVGRSHDSASEEGFDGHGNRFVCVLLGESEFATDLQAVR